MRGDGSRAGPGAALEGADAGAPGAGRVAYDRKPAPSAPAGRAGRAHQHRPAAPAGRDPRRRTGPAIASWSDFLAVPIHRERAPPAAGTNAEVVDLVGAAVVLKNSDCRAAAGTVFCGPQGQTFRQIWHLQAPGCGHVTSSPALAAVNRSGSRRASHWPWPLAGACRARAEPVLAWLAAPALGSRTGGGARAWHRVRSACCPGHRAAPWPGLPGRPALLSDGLSLIRCCPKLEHRCSS